MALHDTPSLVFYQVAAGFTSYFKSRRAFERYAKQVLRYFLKKLGIFTSANAELTLKDGSQARFLKAKLMLYTFKPKVEEELRRLQKEDILTRVEWSEWATQFPAMVSTGRQRKRKQF